MTNRAFSKIWIIIVLIILAGAVIFTWQYFDGAEEETDEQVAEEQIDILREARHQEARENTRESRMIYIGQAMHLAVIDKLEACWDYDIGVDSYRFDQTCKDIEHIVDTCKARATEAGGGLEGYFHDDCALSVGISSAPFDPLLGEGHFYQITNSGANRVKVWAHEDVGPYETEWHDQDSAKTF